MTETKFTPGPWKLLKVGNQWGVTRKAAKRDEDDICDGSQFHDDWKANAALIVAAPELYAFADTVANFTAPGRDPEDDAATLGALIQRARQLTKLARGDAR